MRKLLPLILCCITLTSCSVGMAMSGKRDPNMGGVAIGQDRSIVLLNLGQPDKTYAESGKRIDYFDLQFGNEPSAGRAIGHGVMDVVTLGLWEVVGTPIEGFSGSKQKLVIEYDADERVSKIYPEDSKGDF